MNEWVFSYLALLGAVTCNILGTLLVKHASMQRTLYFMYWFLAGGAALFVGLILYSVALRKLPLSYAQPITAGLGLLGVVLVGAFVFQEPLKVTAYFGAVTILLGIVILNI